METIKLELKYCERCGTLKLRRTASETTYCRSCERLLARFTFRHRAGANTLQEIPPPCELEKLAGTGLSVRHISLSGRVQ